MIVNWIAIKFIPWFLKSQIHNQQNKRKIKKKTYKSATCSFCFILIEGNFYMQPPSELAFVDFQLIRYMEKHRKNKGTTQESNSRGFDLVMFDLHSR